MGDSIADILKSKGPSEPPEIKKIKDFVEEEIGQRPKVAIYDGNFFVYISGSVAASNIRYRIFQLQRNLGLENKIIIKVK